MNEAFDVVTGGSGFIGSHVCRGLLQRGRKVRAIDNLSTGKKENLTVLLAQYPAQIEFFEEDVRNLGRMKALIEGAEVVYHQAALPSVPRSVENPVESHASNVDGTLNVLVAARHGGARKVVFAGSSSVYGDSEVLPKSESMSAAPLSPYALTKYVGEMYCRLFSNIYSLPTVALRYFNVFGPHQDASSGYAAVIPRFISRMMSGRPPVIYGDGEQSRDFTYVENVVEANLQAASSEASSVSLNIACGERLTLNELVRILNEMLGARLEAVYEPPRPGDVRHSQADIALARKEIGFEPTVPFRRGLRFTVEWFQKQKL